MTDEKIFLVKPKFNLKSFENYENQVVAVYLLGNGIELSKEELVSENDLERHNELLMKYNRTRDETLELIKLRRKLKNLLKKLNEVIK